MTVKCFWPSCGAISSKVKPKSYKRDGGEKCLWPICWVMTPSINPYPGSWGHIWLPRLRTGITPQWVKLWKMLKLMYSSKKRLGNISCTFVQDIFVLSTFEQKKAFSAIKSQKVCETACVKLRDAREMTVKCIYPDCGALVPSINPIFPDVSEGPISPG